MKPDRMQRQRFEFKYLVEKSKALDIREFVRNKVILELKFNNRFPRWFGELVRVFDLARGAAAKYCEGVASLWHPEHGSSRTQVTESTRYTGGRYDFAMWCRCQMLGMGCSSSLGLKILSLLEARQPGPTGMALADLLEEHYA